MMTQANIDDALELVVTKFRGVTDQDGEPYVMHCLRVMLGIPDQEAQLVGLMHDLVEDTDVSIEQLRDRGFSPAVVEAMQLITHEADQSYAEYVIALKHNRLACQAKLSDLRDNAAMGRVLYRESSLAKDVHRVQRYILSYQYLSDQIDEVSYRRQMVRFED